MCFFPLLFFLLSFLVGVYILSSLLRSFNSSVTSVLGTAAPEQNVLKKRNGNILLFPSWLLFAISVTDIAALGDAELKSLPLHRDSGRLKQTAHSYQAGLQAFL